MKYRPNEYQDRFYKQVKQYLHDYKPYYHISRKIENDKYIYELTTPTINNFLFIVEDRKVEIRTDNFFNDDFIDLCGYFTTLLKDIYTSEI